MLVTNHQKGIIRLLKGKLELLPGDNDVDADLWKKVRSNQHVVQLIALKRLSVAAGGAVATPLPTEPSAPQSGVSNAPLPKPLTTDMTAKDAIKLIGTSDDMQWLNDSVDVEARSTVMEALDARLETLDDTDAG